MNLPVTPAQQIQVKDAADNAHTDYHFPLWLKVTLGIVGVIVVLILGVYFSKHHGSLGSQEVYGQFGDFIGGTINPILGFGTIVLLIWSIQIQMKELKDSRKELELTRNEISLATKEAALSRMAMESQVAHQIRESKLNELNRLLNEQFNKYKQILGEFVFDQHDLQEHGCSRVGAGGAKTTCGDVVQGKIGGYILDMGNLARLRAYIQSIRVSGTDKATQWLALEHVGISIAKLIKAYIDLHPSPEFESVYQAEVKLLLEPLHLLLLSHELYFAIEAVDPSFNPNIH